MITHNEYRKAVLSDPQAMSPELLEHRNGCVECNDFTQRVLRFEGRLQRALYVDVSTWRGDIPQQDTPAMSPNSATVLPFQRAAGATRAERPRRGWLALAASVLLSIVVGGFWLSVPGYSLAADVVTHMAEEPQAWRTTEVAVPAAALLTVLERSEVRLRPSAGVVSYASSCAFRGHHVPHLVVQTDQGPVTVMVLTHETLHRQATFDEQGYRGVIVPVKGHGSLAVLAKGATADMDEVEKTAARVLAAIDYTG